MCVGDGSGGSWLGFWVTGVKRPGTLFEDCCEPGRWALLVGGLVFDTRTVVGKFATGRMRPPSSELPDVRGRFVSM